MVFKPSFKCFKDKKITFIQAILELETLLYYFDLYYIRRAIKTQKKIGLIV